MAGDAPVTSLPVIGRARGAELAALRALLDAEQLPSSDLDAAALDHFFVARDTDGSLAGTIGLEPLGDCGLLRSLVVRDDARGHGLGRRLTARLERHAAGQGIATLYLLTLDADRFFERLGYERVARGSVPESVAATGQFAGLCPDRAICLTRRL